MSQEASRRPVEVAVIVNSLLLLGLFVWLAQFRNIDPDEGLYLEAARLVAQGKRLYWDFFYQQMPLLPYLYAAWMGIFGFSLESGRMLSVLFSAVTCYLILWRVSRITKNPLTVTLCAVLLFMNGLILAWAPVVKNHAFNMFALTLATVAMLHWKEDPSRRRLWLGIAGFALGCGAGARLTLLPLIPVFLIYVGGIASAQRWRAILLFSLGTGLASILTFYYFFSNPEIFYQYNLLYHTNIFPGIAGAVPRWRVAREALLNLQMIPLLALLAWSWILELRASAAASKDGNASHAGAINRAPTWGSESGGRWKIFFSSDEFLLGLVVAVFILVHLGTATPFTQYFSAIVPLLILGGIPLLDRLAQRSNILALSLLLPCCLLYGLMGNRVRAFEIQSMGSNSHFWDLQKMREVVVAIRSIARPGEPCLTWWSGYAFFGGCSSVSGMENPMRNHAVNLGIPEKTLRDYKMMPEEEFLAALESRRYRVLIAGGYRTASRYSRRINESIKENYHQVALPKGVGIYLANPKTSF